MDELNELIGRLKDELDDHDRRSAACEVEPSDWVEVPRQDLELLMVRARRIAGELEAALARLEAVGKVPARRLGNGEYVAVTDLAAVLLAEEGRNLESGAAGGGGRG